MPFPALTRFVMTADGRLATTVRAAATDTGAIRCVLPRPALGTIVFVSRDGGQTWQGWKAYKRGGGRPGAQWERYHGVEVES